MTVQTSYTIKQPVALPGLIYDLGTKNIISRALETAAGADFGVAMSRGSDADKQTVIGGTSFLGISIRSVEREASGLGSNSNDIRYGQYETVGIMEMGRIWAICPAGCVPGNAVKYNNTTGILDAGSAGVGETQLDGAIWDSTASAGALALIKLTNTNTTAGS